MSHFGLPYYYGHHNYCPCCGSKLNKTFQPSPALTPIWQVFPHPGIYPNQQQYPQYVSGTSGVRFYNDTVERDPAYMCKPKQDT